MLPSEKLKLFYDVYEGKIPARVPNAVKFASEFCIQYARGNLSEAQWDISLLEKVSDVVCGEFETDLYPINLTRIATMYKILGAKTFVMGSNGFLQHPEIHALEPEEYELFSKNPEGTILNLILPRLYENLSGENLKSNEVLLKGYIAKNEAFGKFALIAEAMKKKYAYADLPSFYYPCVEAPFDFIADFIRGFKGVCGDMRRTPERLIAACEAVTPLMIKLGIPDSPNFYQCSGYPLHMPPYISAKDFEKFYWPTFKQTVNAITASGQGIYLFAEHDFTSYLDYFNELPDNLRIRFEYGDPKTIKDKLGSKHVLTGLYPSTALLNNTKKECIDKLKNLLDIMAPAGRYMFDLDKDIITVNSLNPENLKAVCSHLQTDTHY